MINRSFILIVFSYLLVSQSYAGTIDSQSLIVSGRHELGSVLIEKLQYKYTNVTTDSAPGTLGKFLEGEIGFTATVLSQGCSADTESDDRILFNLNTEKESGILSIKVYEKLGSRMIRPEGCVNMPFPIWLHIPFKVFKKVGFSYNVNFGRAKSLTITYVGDDKINVTVNN